METPAEHWGGGSRTSGNMKEAVRAGLLRAEHVWETRVWCHKCSTLSNRNTAQKSSGFTFQPEPQEHFSLETFSLKHFLLCLCVLYLNSSIQQQTSTAGCLWLWRKMVSICSHEQFTVFRAQHVYTDRFRLQRLLFCRITEMLQAVILPLCWKSVLDMKMMSSSCSSLIIIIIKSSHSAMGKKNWKVCFYNLWGSVRVLSLEKAPWALVQTVDALHGQTSPSPHENAASSMLKPISDQQ